jgi:hypothetical protein
MPQFQVLRRYVFVFGLILNLILSSCVTTPKLNQPKTSKTRLEQQTSRREKISPINESRIRTKLKSFKRALKKGKLSKKNWELHDDLLESYIQLKSQQSNIVTIPAHSQIAISLETYCLNSGKAVPSTQEIYHWQKSDPGIKYYKELLDLRRKNKIKQQDLQELLWNLQNETRWDDYPNRLKAVLQSIDSQASLKLPSNLKDQATSLVTDSLLGLPGASEAFDTYNLLKGHYYDFETFKSSVENLTSKHEMSDYQNLTKIPGTNLYSQSQSNGFDNQTITFYNPTDQPQEIDLKEYYLAPERPDVQRIGIYRPIDDPSLLTDLEKVLYEDMARLGLGFVPIVNDIVDLYELLTGKDFISGKSLSLSDRMLSGLGVIAGSGASYRYAKRAIHSPAQYMDEFSEGLSKASKRTASFDKEDLNSASNSLYESSDFFKKASHVKPIETPYGKAKQSMNKEPLKARAKAESGHPLYKVGSRKISDTGKDSQFWSIEPPDLKDYANKYGIPEQNMHGELFIEKGILKEGGHFVTRNAPGVKQNIGGAVEIVVPRGNVSIKGHYSK